MANELQHDKLLAVYAFGDLPSSKYLLQFVNSAVGFANMVPPEILCMGISQMTWLKYIANYACLSSWSRCTRGSCQLFVAAILVKHVQHDIPQIQRTEILFQTVGEYFGRIYDGRLSGRAVETCGTEGAGADQVHPGVFCTGYNCGRIHNAFDSGCEPGDGWVLCSSQAGTFLAYIITLFRMGWGQSREMGVVVTVTIDGPDYPFFAPFFVPGSPSPQVCYSTELDDNRMLEKVEELVQYDIST